MEAEVVDYYHWDSALCFETELGWGMAVWHQQARALFHGLELELRLA
jgi:hypothetical protein